MTLEATIGARIRKARQQVMLTPNELAKIVGTDASVIHQIEDGKARPSAALLADISTTLGAPLSYLFGRDEDS